MKTFYMVKFIDYQIWADNQLIEILKGISDEQFTKAFEGADNSSIEYYVSHILGTADLWLNRLKGVSLEEFPHLEKGMSRDDLFSLWHKQNDEKILKTSATKLLTKKRHW